MMDDDYAMDQWNELQLARKKYYSDPFWDGMAGREAEPLFGYGY